jgi:hypothetical protein
MEIVSDRRDANIAVLPAFQLWNSFPAVLRYQGLTQGKRMLRRGDSLMTAFLTEIPERHCC